MNTPTVPPERCRQILDELHERLRQADSTEMRACYQGLIGHWRAQLRLSEAAQD